MTKYVQRVDGEGFDVPCSEIYRIACCDCGLVHDMVFVSQDGKPIGVAARVNKRATAGKRRKLMQRTKCAHTLSYSVAASTHDELHHCPTCGKWGDGQGKWWYPPNAARAAIEREEREKKA